MRKKLVQATFLLLLIVGTIVIIRQQQALPYRKAEGKIFGTYYHITYQADHALDRQISEVLQRVDASLSTFNSQSVISKINRNEAVKPNEMFLRVFELGQQIARETDGAFDMTVAPLVNAWGFGFRSDTKPTTAAIDSIRQFVGYNKVRLHLGRIEKQDPRLMLDCSAIAKGYGVDCVAALLRQEGVKNFMVEIGGEVITSGINPERLPWRIGVVKPTDDSLQVNQELQTVLNVTNRAMATSGNYRNFYYRDGRKYAHTIDPQTGKPVAHSLLSATVLANNCATADAYATAFMVMGIEKAKALLKQHPELMVYFIYSDEQGNNAIYHSDNLELPAE